MEGHQCWSCGTADVASLFCRYCNSLQSPTPDYYQFLCLPRNLSIDADALQKQFYMLSRALHPDRYTRRSERERRYSLEATAILNDAYRTLRDPILRAEYVLKGAGFAVGGPSNKDVPPELLEEVFELNEALDELRYGDDSVLDQLDESRARFVKRLSSIDSELQDAFRRHDALPDSPARHAVLDEVRRILNRRRYIRNLVNEVDKQLASRNA